MAFGRYGYFPRRFGGGTPPIEAVHRNLLEEEGKGLDISDTTEAFCESLAEALVISSAWAATRRLSNQLQPLKMLENLTVWEESTNLRPQTSDSDNVRRQALAGKLRGVSGNTISDIRDTLAALAPNNFVEVVTTPTAEDVTYWPVINPGPPGFEWVTNSLIIWAHFTTSGLTDDAFDRMFARSASQLDAMLPAHMCLEQYVSDTNGVDTGFILDQSLLDIGGL